MPGMDDIDALRVRLRWKALPMGDLGVDTKDEVRECPAVPAFVARGDCGLPGALAPFELIGLLAGFVYSLPGFESKRMVLGRLPASS